MQTDFGAGGGEWGSMSCEAPEVAKAISTIASTEDTSIRNPLISEVVAEIHDNLPLIPVVWYQHTVSVGDGLQGVVIDPLERNYGLQSVSWSE